MDLSNFLCFDKLVVSAPKIEKKKISSVYIITRTDGSTSENELVYSYEQEVFDPAAIADINLASMILAQVAFNYGLFSREIEFQGSFDDTDIRFIRDMTENTSREIYVNKLLWDNPFIKKEFKDLSFEKKKRYTLAKLTFNSPSQSRKIEKSWQHWNTSGNRICILSSGGKDSLLSYGLMKEHGKEVYPYFINESGRHWFTAINAYRYLKGKDENTGRVWTNSDRIFNWFVRNMPFIREDFNSVRADDYPVRLWTVAVFLFGVLPLLKKNEIARLIIGDEYDTTRKLNQKGLTHYDGLYDQSRYFDNILSRFFMKKGWNVRQFSILRSLSELLILKILVKRYPELQSQQVSCHAAHEEEGRIYPCGNCEKCRRIVGMLKSLDEDPGRCGYKPEQIDKGLQALELRSVKQPGPDASHLYHLLLDKKLLTATEHTRKMARPHPEIMKLRFDRERSQITDIPVDLREGLYKICLQYSDGAVRMENKKWLNFDLLKSDELHKPYPFEIGPAIDSETLTSDFLWAEMTWPDIEEKLKAMDVAILPCGSIEQHGPHLPVDIDAYDAEYLAMKVAEACSDPKPFVLPPLSYGVAYHHEDFKGTISVSNDALSKMVYDIGMSLAKNGIRKLIILNGHGDNDPALKNAAQMINRDANIFVCVETGETSDEDLYKIIKTPNDIHAGEIETSTALAVRPHLVKMDKAKDSTLSFGSVYLDFSSSRGVSWYVRTKKITETGVMGNPTLASAKKGKKMWKIMIAHLVKFVEEIKSSDLEDLYQKRY
jgi:creatinine amidohydrolase/Fe(II)-dependent formamide hydrolase-like protein